MNDLLGIAVVTAIIWIGLFAYVWRLDRKAKKLESFWSE